MEKSKWLPLFKDFISNLQIDSKELGVCRLNQVLYGAQEEFLKQVCEGLEKGIHHFVCLKARQLGISTISLAMDLFWLMVHDGLQGALITDNEGNKEKFRIILERYIAGLPKELRVGIKKHNRNNLVFSNGSVLDYLVAGTRKTGNLGRGRALNFVHATECSSWGDPDGVASLMASMAEEHPDRLYVFESTALGFNLFHDMWQRAEGDPANQKSIFLPWFMKESYKLPKGKSGWKTHWPDTYTLEEQELIDKCYQRHGFRVKDEQIAWYRWKSSQVSGEGKMEEEYPWTPEQAFIATGRGFFNRRQVSRDIKRVLAIQPRFEAYRYHLGDDFLATEVENLEVSLYAGDQISVDDMDLKIWHPPLNNPDLGVYVLGVDPAWGRSENRDRHCISIWRCYADRIVQVAEYATDAFEARQCAWVMCHLAGMYKNCMINYEITGPGNIMKLELEHLQQLLSSGYLSERANKAGMTDIFQAVSWYLWHKPDSMGAGYAYGFSSTIDTKFMIMNQMRDEYSKNALDIKSDQLLQEMLTVVQDGTSIEASGTNKDDRVYACALAVEAWIKWIRPSLIAANKTYAKVSEDEEKKPAIMQSMIAGIIEDTFNRKSSERVKAEFDAMWDV
jgi:hypothetical protein